MLSMLTGKLSLYIACAAVVVSLSLGAMLRNAYIERGEMNQKIIDRDASIAYQDNVIGRFRLERETMQDVIAEREAERNRIARFKDLIKYE